jgi:rubrerythrin
MSTQLTIATSKPEKPVARTEKSESEAKVSASESSQSPDVAFETIILATLSASFPDDEAVQRLEELLGHYNYFQRYYSEDQSQRLVKTIAHTMVRKRLTFLTATPTPKASANSAGSKDQDDAFSFESWKEKRPQKRKQDLNGSTAVSEPSTAVGKKTVDAKAPTAHEWVCATCTYVNRASRSICEICQSPNLS